MSQTQTPPLVTLKVHVGKVVLQVLVLLAVLGVLYHPMTAPLRLSALYLHELGHATVHLATNGQVHAVTIEADESGAVVLPDTVNHGGGLGAIVSGFLGSALLGACTLAGSRSRRSSLLPCIGVGVLALVGGLLLPLNPLAQRCSLCLSAAAIATGFICQIPPLWLMGALVLRAVGTFWCTFTLFDLCSEGWSQAPAGQMSDAASAAAQLGWPPGVTTLVGVAIIGTMTLLAATWSVLANRKPVE